MITHSRRETSMQYLGQSGTPRSESGWPSCGAITDDPQPRWLNRTNVHVLLRLHVQHGSRRLGSGPKMIEVHLVTAGGREHGMTHTGFQDSTLEMTYPQGRGGREPAVSPVTNITGAYDNLHLPNCSFH